jgi:hypothetical protein
MKKLIGVICFLGASSCFGALDAIISCDAVTLKIVATDTIGYNFKPGNSCVDALRILRNAGYDFVSTKISKNNAVIYTLDCHRDDRDQNNNSNNRNSSSGADCGNAEVSGR